MKTIRALFCLYSFAALLFGPVCGAGDLTAQGLSPDVLKSITYRSIGPTRESGRFVDFAVSAQEPTTFYAATASGGLWKTVNNGITFEPIFDHENVFSIGDIAVAPSDPNIVWVGTGEANNSRSTYWGDGVYKSSDAGKSWKNMGLKESHHIGRVVIHPKNPEIVYVAALGHLYSENPERGLYKTTDGGDDHALWIDPQNSLHMLLGYDHGMGITYDGGKNWYHPDQLPLAQFYAVGFDMSYPYHVAGGLQDNGSAMGPSTKRGGAPIRLEDWQDVGGGDGMYNVFDQNTNRFLYNESQFGPLQRIDLLTGERKGIAYQNKNQDLRWNWCAPILVSSHNSDVIYHAGNKLVKSAYRGEVWEEISPDLTTNDPSKLPTGKGGDGNIQHCTITTIDESPLEAGVLWAGTDDGNVWVTRDSGKNWTKLNEQIPGNPGYWVSRVAASAVNPGVAYVSYTGFRNDDFRPFVYKTIDYGQTWMSIAGNLPAEPVNVIREDPKNSNLLFVGTDFAVYVSVNDGLTWSRMKANMPTQPVHDLQIHPRENDLIVATHGRGIFIADISPLRELTSPVLTKDVHLFAIESKVRWVNNRNSHSSSTNFDGPSEPNGIVINYYLKTKIKGEIKVSVYSGNKLINELEAANEPGIQKVVWDMTVRRKRTEEEKKAVEERLRRFSAFGFRGRENPDYDFTPASSGEYRFVLQAGTLTLEGLASILRDYWYEK